MTKQEIKVIMTPRMTLIANYPNSGTEINKPLMYNTAHLAEFPHLFRELKWYEQRSFEDLFRVKYVQVIEYVGYYELNAIVAVNSYVIDSVNAKFIGYYLGDYGSGKSHPHNLSKVIPATKEDFEAYEIKRKGL